MTSRYDDLNPRALWFLNNFDEIDLADICAAQEASNVKRQEALDRVHHVADLIAAGAPWAANRDDLAQRVREAASIDSGQAATGATEAEKSTRVSVALHRSAEDDVSRVIDLYEQWVKAGPPPLGVLINRWWDARLVELHNAILPPQEQS